MIVTDRLNEKKLLHNAILVSLLLIHSMSKKKQRKEVTLNVSTPQRRLRQRIFDRNILMLAASFFQATQQLRIPRLLVIDAIPRVRVTRFDHVSPQFMEENIGYSSDECSQMFIAYGLPPCLVLSEGTRYAFRVNSVHCFLYLSFQEYISQTIFGRSIVWLRLFGTFIDLQ